MAAGIVYLVGAGPGDPGCLTLRGRDCLAAADVVVYDHLANPALLELAPRSAERIFAGKHGAGPHLLEQAEINALLVRRALEGRCVVRLKGGDPLVFGRGGEEAEALVAAGVRFEIVAGVTSALAVPLYAGIPVTHRDWVSGVTILTGHEAPGKRTGRVRWEHLARAGNTLVLLMGVTQLRENLRLLLEHGLAPETPAAAIRWGSTPRQEVLLGTAASLAALVEEAGLRPPVTVVVGEVVRLRERMRWFEARPLFGRRILVTRARAQSSRFAALLAEQGASVVECPTIEIAPPASWAPVDAALADLSGFGWVVFTSVNGVDRFVERLWETGRDPRALGGVQLAAIGPETERALARRGLRADLVAEDFRAEGLIAAFGARGVRGARVLLPRAAGARSVLPRELERLGASVVEVTTYRSVLPEDGPDRLRAALSDGRFDCLTFTSSSTVRNFAALLERASPGAGLEALGRPRVACIGPVTAATAAELGLDADIVPAAYTVPDLCAAIVAAFAGDAPVAVPRGPSFEEQTR